MLKSDVIWPQSRRFKSKTEWEPIGFFSEALCNSTQFDLKLGFFSSSAINVLADGFATFLYNGGRMRMIINDILSNEDKEAILTARDKSLIIPAFNLEDLGAIKDTLSDRGKHFFECLSWLIRNDRLEIKVIRPDEGNGISHSKIGVFSDGLNKVAFDGSCNFSRTALVENRESISAFCDWDSVNDAVRISDIENDFELTFSEKDETVSYLSPDAIRTRISESFANKDIKQLLIDEEEIISNHSQGQLPLNIVNALYRAKSKVRAIIERINVSASSNTNAEEKPAFPYGSPRDYQIEAFNKWKSEPNKQKGLFAMATGTGKTLTSLNCLLNIYNKFNFYKAIILVPTITLVEQWEKECRKFHFNNVIKVCSKNKDWANELDAIKNKENFNFTDVEPSYIVIATYASFARENIFRSLIDFNKKATKQILLIADEAHNMGAGRILDRLQAVKFARRIGLSATPERQFDTKGTKSVMEFFGCSDNEYTFEYSMQDAIDNGYLCRYKYYPHLVRLTTEEMAEYIKISKQLAKYFIYDKESFPQGDDILMNLLLKRKRIIHKASNKEAIFKKILEDRYKEVGNLKYTLVYVPEGSKPDDDCADIFDSSEFVSDDLVADSIIDRYTQIVQDVSPTTTVRKFISGIKERSSILEDFAKGNLEVLTSMKCLDEGVDVPRSELAIFCASTGNPRQFIQRRGRILRLHQDKHMAVIHDLVVVPEVSSASESYAMERSLLATELRRVKDFAMMSENADFAYSELSEILSYYDLSLF